MSKLNLCVFYWLFSSKLPLARKIIPAIKNIFKLNQNQIYLDTSNDLSLVPNDRDGGGRGGGGGLAGLKLSQFKQKKNEIMKVAFPGFKI